MEHHHGNLAGGNIKNIALAAAFLAPNANGTTGMKHLLKAARREYQKLGRNCDRYRSVES
ncbi:MAG: hypothetical protein KME11_05390 [Timaviella obliquedivisa GSE-PSE-MK23-08B]|nr:hypothetical protein [Timaviella obliquedivisa GSE-PSE-MK23-08B]